MSIAGLDSKRIRDAVEPTDKWQKKAPRKDTGLLKAGVVVGQNLSLNSEGRARKQPLDHADCMHVIGPFCDNLELHSAHEDSGKEPLTINA